MPLVNISIESMLSQICLSIRFVPIQQFYSHVHHGNPQELAVAVIAKIVLLPDYWCGTRAYVHADDDNL